MSLLKWLFLFLFIENSHHFANTLESILEIIQRNVADNCLGVHVSSLQRNLQIDPKRTIHNQLSGPHFQKGFLTIAELKGKSFRPYLISYFFINTKGRISIPQSIGFSQPLLITEDPYKHITSTVSIFLLDRIVIFKIQQNVFLLTYFPYFHLRLLLFSLDISFIVYDRLGYNVFSRLRRRNGPNPT